MGTAAHPAFLRGAKTLLLLKLDGERGFGLVEALRHDADGRAVFQIERVRALSPADRAGIAPGDQLLTVQVLGVDTSPFAWSDSALERLERLDEICVVQICVKRHGDARVCAAQQRRHDYMAQWLTKAKLLMIASKRFRGAFISEQLRKVVVLLYDFEHDTFARMWKALANDHERQAHAPLPLARAFVSEAKLPGLMEEAAAGRHWTPPTPPPSPPPLLAAVGPASWKMSDMSTTESQVWTHRSVASAPPSPPRSIHKSEPPPSPLPPSPPRSATSEMSHRSVAAAAPTPAPVSTRYVERSRATYLPAQRYVPYEARSHQRAAAHSTAANENRGTMLQRLIGRQRHAVTKMEPDHEEEKDEDSYRSESGDSDEDSDEEWLPDKARRASVMIKGEPRVW